MKFICSQGPYRDVNYRDPRNTILCTGGILTVRTSLQDTLHYIEGEGDRVMSLGLSVYRYQRPYCIDARQRIVTKSLYGTALTFSILSDLGLRILEI
jgi:hypothetical protein